MSTIALPYLARNQKRQALSVLLSKPWAMLLDSGGHNIDYNRFDIFCCWPTATLSFIQNTQQDGAKASPLNLKFTDLWQASSRPANLKSEPLECMRQLLQHYQPDDRSSKALPFNGGWMGYISYDYARQLEELPEIATDDINLPQVQMGLYQWALITDHQENTTVAYNFGLAAEDWLILSSLLRQGIQLPSSLRDQQNSELTEHQFSLGSQWQSNMTQTDYEQAFERISDYIQAGDCYQINLAQRFSASYSGNVFQAYQRLADANQAPFSAFLNFDDHQILSLSPERFIESHNKKVKTQPIKGTRPRSQNSEKDKALAAELLSSPKDKAENLMIVDLLRNDLSRTAAKQSVKVIELFGHYRFESVHHLISTIESQLGEEFDNFDLLATTLPGGSITGAPKVRAMEIIEELEPVRRNLYCGVIGYLDFNGNMDTNICIRTLIAKNNKLYCWAGGGLVADSEVEKEYQETFDKVSRILPLLFEASIQ